MLLSWQRWASFPLKAWPQTLNNLLLHSFPLSSPLGAHHSLLSQWLTFFLGCCYWPNPSLPSFPFKQLHPPPLSLSSLATAPVISPLQSNCCAPPPSLSTTHSHFLLAAVSHSGMPSPSSLSVACSHSRSAAVSHSDVNAPDPSHSLSFSLLLSHTPQPSHTCTVMVEQQAT